MHKEPRYFLDGLGNVLTYVPIASLGNALVTIDQLPTASVLSASYATTASYASYADTAGISDSASVSIFASLSDTASLAFESIFSDTASLASYSNYAGSASYSISSSYAPFVDNPNAVSASWVSASLYIFAADSASYVTSSDIGTTSTIRIKC